MRWCCAVRRTSPTLVRSFLFPLLMEQGYGYSIAHVARWRSHDRSRSPSVHRSPVTWPFAIGERRERDRRRHVPHGVARALRPPATEFGHVGRRHRARAVGLGMGVACPRRARSWPTRSRRMSSASCRPRRCSRCKSAGAGIQVLETVQQALVRRHGLIHAKPVRRFSTRSIYRSSSVRASVRSDCSLALHAFDSARALEKTLVRDYRL